MLITLAIQIIFKLWRDDVQMIKMSLIYRSNKYDLSITIIRSKKRFSAFYWDGTFTLAFCLSSVYFQALPSPSWISWNLSIVGTQCLVEKWRLKVRGGFLFETGLERDHFSWIYSTSHQNKHLRTTCRRWEKIVKELILVLFLQLTFFCRYSITSTQLFRLFWKFPQPNLDVWF